jgi:hypothetical protein
MSRNRSNDDVCVAAVLFWSRSLAKCVLIASASRRRDSAFCWVSTLPARASPVMNTEAAERRFDRTASNVVSTSRSASGESSTPRLRFFAAKSHDVALDDVAGALEIEVKGQYGFKSTMLVIGHAVRIKAGHILLDLAVERVENVVEAPRPGDCLSVPPAQCVCGAFDHRVEQVDHTQDLSRGMAERNGRRFRRRGVEIERPGGVGGFDPVRQHPLEQT